MFCPRPLEALTEDLVSGRPQPGVVAALLPEGRVLKAPLLCPPGPPAPPQDIAVQAAATPATVQVSWKPPALTATGLSNGANVTGYGVYAKGQRVSPCGGSARPRDPSTLRSVTRDSPSLLSPQDPPAAT